MYHKAYGIIETLAPLHVGASAGEETGNLNLIFRDQFTLTGIIPGSSIRGRFRADMRDRNWKDANLWYGHEAEADEEQQAQTQENESNQDRTTEAIVKFEYASLLWLPLYCPNQPIVWVSCPRLLNRYQKLSGLPKAEFKPYSYYTKNSLSMNTLFFSLGFLNLQEKDPNLKNYIPASLEDLNPDKNLVLVVNDTDIAIIHEMALFRQSRVALEPTKKKAKRGAFFDVEALPQGTVLTFTLALKPTAENPKPWEKFTEAAGFSSSKEMYFGGLESIGFGRTHVTLNPYNEAK
ncbi:type III-B CRISPR module RAMP protein Cmr4 [Phormidium pseudopriestleyi FRX01]|uniref:Type III-B CRISPR module RAMP protein Cmr4 n=1 Tax=Phormidium pseudopriestleyi FRX01 TaxID=1759528 RepID=A0ABS3FZX3_9CYAN|nr:RAMP superfamily CRISPR-associated protein [Phormidium pseudopriestleyi]MBO0352359.1 type III-B CRISPR module RAMP protein Cmr4 [Phormidium pseudopriestleyi FRX01]